MHTRIYFASDLLYQVKRTCQEHLGWVAVRGELSNFKVPRSGHFYFRIKDSKGALDAVMFRLAQEDLRFLPEDGMEVICWGQCDVYAPQGRLQLIVECMDRVGKGHMATAFEQLKRRLDREGLFALDAKRPLPYWPRKIALVTSATGAAVQDLLHVITRRAPSCSIVLAPCLVQGARAAPDIVRTIKAVESICHDVDLIILGRGGGSSEDLWPFNEEIVARTIFACSIPILTGIGHETDLTLADAVADAFASTPSAAAERAVPEEHLLLHQWEQGRERLIRGMQHCIQTYRKHLELAEQRLSSPQSQIESKKVHIRNLRERLQHAMTTVIQNTEHRLAFWAGQLDSLSPLRVLDRGYARVHKEPSGQTVRTVHDLEVGEHVQIQLQKGAFEAEVVSIQSKTVEEL